MAFVPWPGMQPDATPEISGVGGKDAKPLYLELLKMAPDDRNRMTVADALFRAEGFDFFKTLQGLFGELPFAKKLYVDYFDKKVKGQASQPGATLEPKNWKAKASHVDR